MLRKILEFVNHPTYKYGGSESFNHVQMHLYIRNINRVLYKEYIIVEAIVISSITVTPVQTKIGTAFIDQLHLHHNKEVTIIESVINPGFECWLLKNGFRKNVDDRGNGTPNDYYKLK